jgi:hypothetical protein
MVKKIVWKLVIRDKPWNPCSEGRLEACDRKRAQLMIDSGIQRPVACCLIRFVSSVT